MLVGDKILIGLFASFFGALGDVGLQRQVLSLFRHVGLYKVRTLGDSDQLLMLQRVLWLLELLRLSVVLILVAKVELPVVERDRLGQVGQLRVDDWAWCVHVQLAATVGRNAQVRVRQVWDGSSVQLDHLGKERRLG